MFSVEHFLTRILKQVQDDTAELHYTKREQISALSTWRIAYEEQEAKNKFTVDRLQLTEKF